MYIYVWEICLVLGKFVDDVMFIAVKEAVGLENVVCVLKLYLFEMSGGMLQCMMIVMVVLCELLFIIVDELIIDFDVVV